jgi:hypothetical protein
VGLSPFINSGILSVVIVILIIVSSFQYCQERIINTEQGIAVVVVAAVARPSLFVLLLLLLQLPVTMLQLQLPVMMMKMMMMLRLRLDNRRRRLELMPFSCSGTKPDASSPACPSAAGGALLLRPGYVSDGFVGLCVGMHVLWIHLHRG